MYAPYCGTTVHRCIVCTGTLAEPQLVGQGAAYDRLELLRPRNVCKRFWLLCGHLKRLFGSQVHHRKLEVLTLAEIPRRLLEPSIAVEPTRHH